MPLFRLSLMSNFENDGGSSPSLSQPSWKKVTIDVLPEDLLLDVLSLVPRKDLILSCRLVCSWWRDLVDLPVLWKRKCQRFGLSPGGKDSRVQDWRTFYFHYCEKNLVKNPCGEEGLSFWKLFEDQCTISPDGLGCSNTWLYKLYPQLHRPPPDIQKCFTLFRRPPPESGRHRRYPRVELFDVPHIHFPLQLRPAFKKQVITLRDEGYSDRMMDETRPKIVVKDRLHSADDRRPLLQLCVKLLSEDFRVIQDCCLRNTSHEEWKEVSYIFEGYPSGVRHISLEHNVETPGCVKVTKTSITIDPEETG